MQVQAASLATAPAAEGLMVSVTASAPWMASSQLTRTVVQPACSWERHQEARPAGPRGRGRRKVRTADGDLMAVYETAGAQAGEGDEAAGRRPGRRLGEGQGGDGGGDGVLGGLLDRPREPEQIGAGVPGMDWTAVTVIWPLVTVPVLSRTTVSMAREDSRAW